MSEQSAPPGPAGAPAPAAKVASNAPAGRPAPTARAVAVDVLERIDAGAYANRALPGELRRSGLDARDRALVTELVYGTTRMRRSCDWLIDAHLLQSVPDARVRAALRLGAYQLAYLRIPAHAAVSATVSEAPERARGLVNAVLRKVAIGPQPAWPDRATELSYPDWIVDLLERDLGAAVAGAALAKMNEAATVSSRPDGYVQDPGSQWVAALVGARAGERVAELCAAPGGKATGIAGLAGSGPSLVVAAELRPARARAMRESIARLGLDGAILATGVAASSPAPDGGPPGPDVGSRGPSGDLANRSVVATVVADGRRPALAPGSFDRVLVDAPCSGLGVLRRRADARWRARAADVDRLAGLQRGLLGAAAGLLRPGGVLVYSVCTLTVAETRGIDDWLAAAHPGLVAIPPPPAPWAAWGRGALLLPQAAGTDGMYLLRLSLGRHEAVSRPPP